MQDIVIKGTGNSRTLASVPNLLTLYPTYEAFAQALIAGELPIDLGPLNETGVDTMGTALNKANLLTDATAALFGLTSDAVPDDVLAAISETLLQLDNTRAKIQYGSYAGTGTGGESNPNSLVFDFEPKVVMVFLGDAPTYSYRYLMQEPQFQNLPTITFFKGQSKYTVNTGWSNGAYFEDFGTISAWGNTIKWYATVSDTFIQYMPEATAQLNQSGVNYYYLALG